MKNFTARLLRKIANRLSPPVVRPPGNAAKSTVDPTENLFRSLQQLDFSPRHVVDVGANHGRWTRKALKYYPDAAYTLLEPQPWLEEQMRDVLSKNPKVQWHSVGAGAQPGTLPFTIVDRDDSSTFRLNAQQAEELGFRQIEVPVVRLDELLADSEPPDLIKIDAEGLDLDVLEGATSLLPRCEVLLMEASVMCKGFTNTVPKVIETASGHGFTPFDITDLNRTEKHGCLWLVEIAFVKAGGQIDRSVDSYV